MSNIRSRKKVECESCGLMVGVNAVGHHRRACAGPERKKCAACGEVKPFDEYGKRKAGAMGIQSECRPCMSQRRSWRRVLDEYGITEADFRELEAKQGGRCAICSSLPEERSTRCRVLSVDHCHETGKVRGLLCDPCNRGLGFLGDSEDSLAKALDYLRKS